IAQAYFCMGQTDKAKQFEANVESSEAGKVARVRAMQADEATFDAEIKALDACVASKNFDALRNTLESSTQLYDRFYGNAERRNLIENKLKESWKTMPLLVRIEILMELSRIATQHGDKAKAMELAGEIQEIVDGATWPTTYRIVLAARVALAQFQAGDSAKSRTTADAALSLFDTERDQIIDIERAQCLLPLAETYKAMGDTSAALTVYKRAIENSVINPNSRPRAEDLSAICRSMAKHAVEPDAAMWSSIRKSNKELGHPW
ncbi:MAG: hypothetical protein EHM48_03915, partial [Planctomycetaceae bacterium]